ncbi:MAG: hypothetical protein M3296_01390 [Actinomycetota bacterium]|nr:hypothetical protein [Actinomycetota bacterium]
MYVALNAVAAVAALGLLRTFDWNLGIGAEGAGRGWGQVLVAGFGAMVLLRSSLFVVRVGDQDVGVGPSSFLSVVLGAADRAVDRSRARVRADQVARAMEGVAFAKASEALPALCLALMQNASEEEKVALANQVKLLRSAAMEDRSKSLALGLALMNVVGGSVLSAAVLALQGEIHADAAADALAA